MLAREVIILAEKVEWPHVGLTVGEAATALRVDRKVIFKAIQSANNRMMCAFVVIGLRAYAHAVKDAPVELTPDLVHPLDWL